MPAIKTFIFKNTHYDNVLIRITSDDVNHAGWILETCVGYPNDFELIN